MTTPDTPGPGGGGLHRLDRWMYRGGRPNRLARALNRLWAAVFAAGLLQRERLATLEVRGRRTGRLISFPVVVADHEGGRYLVAMLGAGTQWARNVRAAGGEATLRHGRREPVRLAEVPEPERAPILRRYLACSPGGRTHIPVEQDAPLAAFERVAARYPVFRIEPR
ncbi:nitroreductase/quinone reductase family protein [Actinomadura sp. ATCC 31491]|uniref:Nitroreductase/quinone reductase family protein n=1 Tax=Actinomadura luzonensis TaxID=2805427 RepID=A0ABT0FX10_9ACTN|nr:nitroreductase/quinone reductase family protein [Actinomadura luzonensis]MCK2216875.1 nitroreductase/quinone reductase family protein [Actinomadura luzonensis]